VQPYDDPRLGPIELGASIFVEVNKNLWRASHEFGLNLTDSSEEGADTLGIWDGKEFILTVRVLTSTPIIRES
jgi:prenylcysteine oxidase / farnesylcysteine lyase